MNAQRFSCAMIAPMSANVSISLDTRILDLAVSGISRFGPQTASKLALALTEVSPGKEVNNVNVGDLLNYLPMRYEDRSGMVEIRHLYHGLEASLDLTVRVAGGYPVRNRPINVGPGPRSSSGGLFPAPARNRLFSTTRSASSLERASLLLENGNGTSTAHTRSD